MESAFSKIYLALQDRITEECKAIRWVEQDFGQDNHKERPNVAFPAVLIDFTDAKYDELGNGGQTCMLTVRVRLLFATFSQSYNVAPDEVREKALEYFEVEKRLVDALHCWQPQDNVTGEPLARPLIRTSATSDNRGDNGLRIRELEFTTEFEEF